MGGISSIIYLSLALSLRILTGCPTESNDSVQSLIPPLLHYPHHTVIFSATLALSSLLTGVFSVEDHSFQARQSKSSCFFMPTYPLTLQIAYTPLPHWLALSVLTHALQATAVLSMHSCFTLHSLSKAQKRETLLRGGNFSKETWSPLNPRVLSFMAQSFSIPPFSTPC